MAGSEAFEIIEARLRENWTATALVFENETWPLPAAPAHFLFVEVVGDVFDQASIGAGEPMDNLWRETGQLYLHVMTTTGIGSRRARQLARAAADLFLGQDIDGLVFRDASIGAGEPGQDDGNFWRMTALINWQRDE